MLKVTDHDACGQMKRKDALKIISVQIILRVFLWRIVWCLQNITLFYRGTFWDVRVD